MARSDSGKAIDILQSAQYDGGMQIASWALYGQFVPVYIRGMTYLAAHRGNEAAPEFEKILAHKNVVRNDTLYPLSYVGLARAYALSHDRTKALEEYRHFLTLWKDADPDVPILKQAKAEYAKLQ